MWEFSMTFHFFFKKEYKKELQSLHYICESFQWLVISFFNLKKKEEERNNMW
jgi:hypothetical protein